VVREAIRLGIDKVNVNTALRRAFLTATEAALPGAEPTADLSALFAQQAAAVEAVARSTMVEGCLAENSDLVGRL